MNYKKIYDSLIEKAKNRTCECYVEKHHVIPRCMSGTDCESNLVSLLPEEHYFAHQLLLKMYPNSKELAYAAKMMSIGSKNNGNRSNKLYGWIRKRFRESISNELKGKRYFHNPETKEILIVKKNEKDPLPESGFIKGRGYSPTKGTSFKKSGKELERSRILAKQMAPIALKARWEKYEQERIQSGIGSREEVINEIMKLNEIYENKIELVKLCMNRFDLSRGKIYKILSERGVKFEGAMNTIIRSACNAMNIDFGVESLRDHLLKSYDFSKKRPPYKKIGEDYNMLTKHVLNFVMNS